MRDFFVKPELIGLRATGTTDKVDALNAARIARKDNEDIRALVVIAGSSPQGCGMSTGDRIYVSS